MERKVAVVYYLSRNGQLEHPHFIQVPLSSCQGLYLRDVLRRLDFLRGKGMATMYSWSSKRNYKNGFVWQDLSDDDLIHPSHGSEYILKGSELVETSGSFRYSDEYKVYKLNRTAGKVSSDMGTQTGTEETCCKRRNSSVSELCREEISPPSSTASSTEAREIIVVSSKRMSVDGREEGDRMVGVDRLGSGRIRVTDALKQLVTCGSKVEVESTKSSGDEVIGRRRSVDMGRERERGTIIP